MEACSRLLFTLLVSLKLVFFYTSCQPNWSLVSDVVFGGQEKVHMVIPLIKNKTTLGTRPTIYQDSMYMEQSITTTDKTNTNNSNKKEKKEKTTTEE